jgi:hypothetical protein
MRDATTADMPRIAAIYGHQVRHGVVLMQRVPGPGDAVPPADPGE